MKWSVKQPAVWLPLLPLELALWAVRQNTMDGFSLLLWALLLVFGYAGALWDLKFHRVPNILVAAMACAWAVALVPQLFFHPEAALVSLTNGAVGFLLAGIVFMLVYLISRKGLGGGDVKFMSVSGLYLGASHVLPAMLYGCVLAAAVGVTLLALKKLGRKDAIPLVPFLYAGMLLTMLFR